MARQIVTKEEAVQMKRERVPLHEARDKIKTRGLDHENFHYIFINIQDADNVDRYLSAGYVPVQSDGKHMPGDKVVDSFIDQSSIITIGGGKGAVLGLFCVPMEFYLADQDAEEQERKDVENGLIRNINSMADSKKGGLGTGVTAFNSQINSKLDQAPE